MKHADSILIQGLEFYGYHGVSDVEQTIGHRYRVDARLTVETGPAALSDSIADTVNYAEVIACILEIGSRQKFRLLEALSEHLAETILTQFGAIQTIQLRVQKLLPPMNAVVEAVGVEITRSRSDYKL